MTVEQREANRRILRVRASVHVGQFHGIVRTHDISIQGISLLLPVALKEGTRAQVEFSLFQDGKIRTMLVEGKTIHCTLSEDTFRTGLAFTSLAPDQRKIITGFCNER